MAGSGIERTSRPVPSGRPSGVSTPMPPHIQGAEWRAGRRARWGLRALVIGGLTGAVWLLTGVAAHAADRDVETVGTPERPAVTHVHGGTTVDATVPHEVAAPTRLTDGSADLRQRRTTASVSDSRIPSLSAADPGAEHPVVRRPGDERPGDVFPAARRPHIPAVTPRSAVVRASSPRALRAGRSMKDNKAAHRRSAVASATADGPVPDRRDTPGGDGPAAPPRPYLGDSGGSAALGSATQREGGCAAFLPAAIADSTTACDPRLIATDVDARRHDAEAPTVSPD